MRNKELVFVYGTLKNGFHNHRYLIGFNYEKAFAPNIDLHAGPLYPFAKRGTNIACGELYEVDQKTLARLDSLEGHPNYYRREKIIVISKGKQIKAWIYLYDKAEKYPLIESGFWDPAILKHSA